MAELVDGDARAEDRGFKRQDTVVVEGQLLLEFAIIPEEDDRIIVDGFDLHDLIASQFSDVGDMNRRQRLGKFRITIERLSYT